MKKSLGLNSVALITVAGMLCGGCRRDPESMKQKYLASGRKYQKIGKMQDASIQFANAVRVDRNFADAHYELAKTDLQMGNVTSAYQELMTTVELAPRNAQARIDLGNVLLAGRQPEQALEQATAVVAIDPGNADAFALESHIAEKRGNAAEALVAMQHALALEPNRASFHTMLAVLNSTAPHGDEGAERELRNALTLNTKNADAHLLLATLLEKKADLHGAELENVAAVNDEPKNLHARAQLAALYLRYGDKARVEQTLRQAAEDFPENQDAAEALREYYVATRQADRAATAYSQLSARFPESIPIRVAYAKILLDTGDSSKSRKIVDSLRESNPDDPEVSRVYAHWLTLAGKDQDALTELQATAKVNQGNVGLQIQLARAANKSGDLNGSQAAFRQAALHEPRNLEAQSGLAAVSSRLGDWNHLALAADKTLSLHVDDADAYLWRGTAEANLKESDRAEQDFRNALRLDPKKTVAMTELGQLLLAKHRRAEGTAMLEQALAEDPHQIRALNLLVSEDLTAKQPARAIARIRDQIARGVEASALYTDLATLQIALKDFPAARDSANTAMQQDPTSTGAIQAYTQAEAILGETDRAIATWQSWIRTHPNDATATALLGSLEEVKGDTALASQYYLQTLRISPGQVLASNNLAYLMVENGQDVDVALDLAQGARRLMPDSPNIADTLAWVLYYKGRYSSSAHLLEDALHLAPDNASMHYHLGMSYLKLSDPGKAETHLKKAASLAPNTKVARDAGAMLAKI